MFHITEEKKKKKERWEQQEMYNISLDSYNVAEA